MTRLNLALLVGALALGGCLTTGGGGFDDDDDDITGDGDSDTDTDVDTDADTDTDTGTGSDTGTGTEEECPPYPAGPYGYRQGDIVENIALSGGGGDIELVGNVWHMEDFWCMAHRAENQATVLFINVHSMT